MPLTADQIEELQIGFPVQLPGDPRIRSIEHDPTRSVLKIEQTNGGIMEIRDIGSDEIAAWVRDNENLFQPTGFEPPPESSFADWGPEAHDWGSFGDEVTAEVLYSGQWIELSSTNVKATQWAATFGTALPTIAQQPWVGASPSGLPYGWASMNGTLTIEFLNGGFYQYADVSLQEATDFATNASPGGWVWDHLRLRGTVFGWKKPYTYLPGPSSYVPVWYTRPEWQAQHAEHPPGGEDENPDIELRPYYPGRRWGRAA